MRDTWFISDTHFGHENIIKYCRTQFGGVDEMHDHIVTRWNETVKTGDLVYHLGDFAWTLKAAKQMRPVLNGTIRLVVGNHDDIPKLAATGMFQRIHMWRIFREQGFTASHVPMRGEQLRHERYGPKNLHGHVHGNSEGLESFHRDVSVEAINYTPVHLDEVAQWAQA